MLKNSVKYKCMLCHLQKNKHYILSHSQVYSYKNTLFKKIIRIRVYKSYGTEFTSGVGKEQAPNRQCNL